MTIAGFLIADPRGVPCTRTGSELHACPLTIRPTDTCCPAVNFLPFDCALAQGNCILVSLQLEGGTESGTPFSKT